MTLEDDTRIVPWGWSAALCHQLKQAGVQESLLPSVEKLEQIRQLSHRQTAVALLKELQEQLPLDGHLVGESTLCHNMEEVEEAISSLSPNPSSTREGNICALLKSPWSSSGRGIKTLSDSPLKGENLGVLLWAKRIIKSQGSIVVEKFLHKVADFALEFWLDGKGGVEYRGLSLFYTNERGAYLGNWVAPEGQKLAWLAQYIPLQYLQEIRRWWEERLRRFDYSGPVGIDMMLAEEGICPCIEVNWRWTMGLVSCLVSEQGRYGRMVVEYIYGHYSAEVEAFS